MNYISPVKNILGLENISMVEIKTGKENRGFNHYATARLLCPRDRRDDFDMDMEAFCRDVQNGNRAITHNTWPSFLYPEDAYNPEILDEGLLRGPFLVSVSLSITCIRIANLYLVLSTPVYRTTYGDESNRWQVTR